MINNDWNHQLLSLKPKEISLRNMRHFSKVKKNKITDNE